MNTFQAAIMCCCTSDKGFAQKMTKTTAFLCSVGILCAGAGVDGSMNRGVFFANDSLVIVGRVWNVEYDVGGTPRNNSLKRALPENESIEVRYFTENLPGNQDIPGVAPRRNDSQASCLRWIQWGRAVDAVAFNIWVDHHFRLQQLPYWQMDSDAPNGSRMLALVGELERYANLLNEFGINNPTLPLLWIQIGATTKGEGFIGSVGLPHGREISTASERSPHKRKRYQNVIARALFGGLCLLFGCLLIRYCDAAFNGKWNLRWVLLWGLSVLLWPLGGLILLARW
jgi:hypothetical protein